ncbi:MAG: winged helix-turn-helix domain-containing protein [Porphyromonadaceae bacterium]|nr:winged helix-turn-helix domain-containing protein [Porphyromonadaceae bacterium]
MIEKIGNNAGKVWTVLDEAGRQNVKEVKKTTKLTDKDLYAAIGWLAREGKISLEEVEKELYISLN